MADIVKITDALGRMFTARLPYTVAMPGGPDDPDPPDEPVTFHTLTLGGEDLTLNSEPLTLGV